MTHLDPSIKVKVDVTNPGQFFACCGLLELADRVWPGAEGWFEEDEFCITCNGTLVPLLHTISETELAQINFDDDMASPIRLPKPFDLTLDWWTDELTNGGQLKVWAGSMRGVRIARAMQGAIANICEPYLLFNHAEVVYDPDQGKKKVEPYYFDCRRGWNARSLDIGFATDSLKMTTVAYPAVELLCLIGLQRFRPAPTNRRRVFDYYVWGYPIPASIAALAVGGEILATECKSYRFENAFRTDQKKHKSFLPATRNGV